MLQNLIDFSNTELGGILVGFLGIPIIMSPAYFNERKKGQLISALILGVAAGAYINSGFGVYETPLTMLMLFFAFKATSSWAYVGVGWITHAILDLVHHNIGTPLFDYYSMSSVGCAALDFVVGFWFLMGEKYLPSRKSLKTQAA